MTELLDYGWQCPACKTIHSLGVVVCPCGKLPEQGETRATPSKPRDMDTMLTYAQYRTLSSNKVSREEYRRYTTLFAMQRAGIISNLELQIKYTLIEGFRVPKRVAYYRGFKQADTTYSPDFRYTYKGCTFVEEYKGLTKTKQRKRPRPRINTSAKLKVSIWVSQHIDQLMSGELFFCFSAWDKQARLYRYFDPNKNEIDNPFQE